MYEKLNKEKLEEIIKDSFSAIKYTKEKDMIIYTGGKGNYDFSTHFMIEDSSNLKEHFKYTREELYKINKELVNIKSKRIYKLLKFLKLI